MGGAGGQQSAVSATEAKRRKNFKEKVVVAVGWEGSGGGVCEFPEQVCLLVRDAEGPPGEGWPPGPGEGWLRQAQGQLVHCPRGAAGRGLGGPRGRRAGAARGSVAGWLGRAQLSGAGSTVSHHLLQAGAQLSPGLGCCRVVRQTEGVLGCGK